MLQTHRLHRLEKFIAVMFGMLKEATLVVEDKILQQVLTVVAVSLPMQDKLIQEVAAAEKYLAATVPQIEEVALA